MKRFIGPTLSVFVMWIIARLLGSSLPETLLLMLGCWVCYFMGFIDGIVTFATWKDDKENI